MLIKIRQVGELQIKKSIKINKLGEVKIDKLTKTLKPKKLAAISLVELAIGLVILGIVMVPAMNLTMVAVEKGKQERTRAKMERIGAAMDSYFYINRKLPCPALRAKTTAESNYGSAATSCGTTGVVFGVVPAETIGLSRDFMFDGYGRKFSYAVASMATLPNGSGGVRFVKSGSTIIADNGGGTELTTAQKITIKSGSGANITTDGAFVLISHGKDGLGAAQPDGSVLSAPQVSSTDFANAQTTSTAFNSLLNGESGGDDIVFYSTFGSFVPKLVEYSSVECPATSFSSSFPVTNTNYTFPRTYGGNLVFPTSITCPTDKPNTVDKASAYCSKSGDWVGFKPQICSASSQVGGVRLNGNTSTTFVASGVDSIVNIPNVMRQLSINPSGTLASLTPDNQGIISLQGSGGTTLLVDDNGVLTINSPTVSVSNTTGTITTTDSSGNPTTLNTIKSISLNGVTLTNTNGVSDITIKQNGTSLTATGGVVNVQAITGVQLNGTTITPTNAVVNVTPFSVGDYKYSALTANHNGWILCDGDLVSATTMTTTQKAALYAVIGNKFGGSLSSTGFQLPDFRGKVFGAVGQGSGLTNRVIGANTGVEKHTLTESEMPSHTHSYSYATLAGYAPYGDLANPRTVWERSTIVDKTTGVKGSDDAHNNMQPTLFAGNVFIFAGV